ncbi:MarR family transcriptional regulator [Caproiciproducens sp. NJN-50]|uniref:MarR family transcriptional regulator n=1 Tax=Acutalibacteraceae TaxID=3082771 RepID=UPI000FFE27A2|nr:MULTISPECIES: MarR family transcriptional regulator [Acutalibacteraceae]QAT49042.1 MarR family transcriptional regulator [Caproiciproducens sp. NJN-50]
MPEEGRTGEATKRLLDAMVQFRRLRDIPYRGKHPQSHECRHSDMMILFALKQLEPDFPEGVSIKELSRCLNLKSPTVTPAAYHLEKMDLVERSTDDRDRRINRIRLTEGGRRLLLAHRRRLAAHIHGLVLYLGAEKSLMLAELLDEAFRYEFGQIQQKNNLEAHHPGGL